MLMGWIVDVGKLKRRIKNSKILEWSHWKIEELPFAQKGTLGMQHILWRKSNTSFRYVSFEMHIIHRSGDSMQLVGYISQLERKPGWHCIKVRIMAS